MRKPSLCRRGLRASIAVLVVATVARADAPSDQYGLFDATDVVIHDRATNLTWERSPDAAVPLTFSGASIYCSTLSLPNWPGGWRVPSYKELLTLVDEIPHPEYRSPRLVWIANDSNAFAGTLDQLDWMYWTSSFAQGSRAAAYFVNFNTGEGGTTATSSAETHYVRCVHD